MKTTEDLEILVHEFYTLVRDITELQKEDRNYIMADLLNSAEILNTIVEEKNEHRTNTY